MAENWMVLLRAGERTREARKAFYRKLESLDGGQLVMLWREMERRLGDEKKLEDCARVVLGELTGKDPQAALRLNEEFFQSGVLKEMESFFIGSALSQWASSDPEAAYDWVCSQGQLDEHSAISGLLKGAMWKDPKAAYQIFQKFSPELQDRYVGNLLGLSVSPEQRLETLNLLREGVGRIEDPQRVKWWKGNMIRDLMGCVVRQPGGLEWIDQAQLSMEEKIAFAKNLGGSLQADEQQWLLWTIRNLSADEASESIRPQVAAWTQKDHQAVAAWLNESPSGSAKDAAVKSFAIAVAGNDIQSAIEWTNTLSEQKEREDTYRILLLYWPLDDPEGKATFAAEHGLK
ncbi:MAG: hypothetical protein QM627_00875 [Luteolibacter sp.]